jgi:hypothetical protein
MGPESQPKISSAYQNPWSTFTKHKKPQASQALSQIDVFLSFFFCAELTAGNGSAPTESMFKSSKDSKQKHQLSLLKKNLDTPYTVKKEIKACHT